MATLVRGIAGDERGPEGSQARVLRRTEMMSQVEGPKTRKPRRRSRETFTRGQIAVLMLPVLGVLVVAAVIVVAGQRPPFLIVPSPEATVMVNAESPAETRRFYRDLKGRLENAHRDAGSPTPPEQPAEPESPVPRR